MGDYLVDNKQATRLYINVAKGIAIILMLWGHCIQYSSAGSFDFYENIVFKTIYSFHMPFFMMISGYLFFFSCKKRTMKELLIHRIQSSLQPIIMCGIMYYLLTTGIKSVLANHSLVALFGGKWLGALNSFWFLWSVLASVLAVGFAYKSSNKRGLQILLMLLGAVFVCFFPNAEMNLYMYPYFVVGFLYARYMNNNYLRKLHWLKYSSFIFFPLMIVFFSKEHYIYTSGFLGENGLLRHMPVNLFRYTVGFVGCVLMFTVLEILFKKIDINASIPKRILGCIGMVGEKSLQIYILSCIFLSAYYPPVYGVLVKYLGTNFPTFNMFFYNFVFTLIVSVLYTIVLMTIVRILERCRISRILFGK